MFRRGPEWEILEVDRSGAGTRVVARHLKTGRIVELLAGAAYAPHVRELKRDLRFRLDQMRFPEFDEHRRRRLDSLAGKKV